MTEPTIIGAEWVARYPERFALSLHADVGLERASCPVCGHPTGDCAPHTEVLMAQGSPAKKAPAKRAPAKSAAAPAKAAEKDTPDPAAEQEDTRSAAEIAKAEADDSQPTEEQTGLPLGQPAAGLPVGVSENLDVTGGTHAVSVALDEAMPTPRKREKGTIPDGFRRDGATLIAEKSISVTFIPAGAKRRSRLLVFPEGSRWTEQSVLDRLAMYEDREDAELV